MMVSWVWLYTVQTPVFSRTKVLLIGVSHYQDPEILDLQLPHRDAEHFAGYLKSGSGMRLASGDLQLLTNARASVGQVMLALDRLFDQTSRQDTLILYYAGYGFIDQTTTHIPGQVFYYDTPLQVSDAGSFDLFGAFKKLASDLKICHYLFANIYPIWLPDAKLEEGMMERTLNRSERKIPHTLYFNNIPADFDEQQFKKQARAKFSLNSYLLEGMKGWADQNADQLIKLKELGWFFKNVNPQEGSTLGFLSVSVHATNPVISKTDQRFMERIRSGDNRLGASLVYDEELMYEPLMQGVWPDSVQKLLEDYIVQLKLGQLMAPSDQNASMICEQLIRIHELEHLHGEIRRRLAAALQDEVQQALNDYIAAESQELTKRARHYDYYIQYRNYLQKAEELLGQRHYMLSLIRTKKLYFEGLVLRMRGQKEDDQTVIEAAIQKQEEALTYESEASFVLNELGINYGLLGLTDRARKYFMEALEVSPAWSMPYVNLANLYLKTNATWSLNLVRQALRLQPENSLAHNMLGLVHMQQGQYVLAERSFSKALSLNPDHPWFLYNFACLHSLTGQTVTACDYLDRAFKNGLADVYLVLTDPDLENLRASSEWDAFIQKHFPDHVEDK